MIGGLLACVPRVATVPLPLTPLLREILGGDVARERDYFEVWGRIELRADGYIDAAPDLIANHQRRCLAAQATTVRVPTGEALRDGLDRLVRGISGS